MSVYDVTITAAGLGGAAPADGFIDPRTPYYYMDSASDAPNTLALAQAKIRANRRFKMLVMQIDQMTNAYVQSVTSPGATADTSATSITLRIEIEHGDDALKTADENNAGQFLTGLAAIKRAFARSLLISETRNSEVYDPTVVPGRQIDGQANAGLARGPVISVQTIGALAANLAAAEAAITVTKIS